jgi:predicted metallo-beta-lactamase superfamily hydrolase
MEIIPLASETLGVRSMAVAVKTRDCVILIDPAVSLAPKRYGLGPHEIEWNRERTMWDEVREWAKRADIITISHYHYDHHDPEQPGIFRGKKLLVKHPTENINKSQTKRASLFETALDDLPESVEFADGRTFEFGNTIMTFSEAVPHGTNTRLGYVVQLAIDDGKTRFLHTSDVEGPSLDCQVDFILEQKPDVLACDGPMTYLMYRYGNKAMERSLTNLQRIITDTGIRTMMLDHHLTRDINWRRKMEPVFAAGEAHDCDVTTFAGYLGKEDDLLEARRKHLWGEDKQKG